MLLPPHPPRRVHVTVVLIAATLLLAACANPGHRPRDPEQPKAPETRDTPETIEDARAIVSRLLDDFHDAAAKADEARYLGHFAPEGVFLGTDATERWPLETFRPFVHEYFSQGKGWTYVPRERHVDVQGSYAWFDEIVQNEHYGTLRGSGALRRIDGEWKLLQYNLAFLVPNDEAQKVVEIIGKKAD